MRGESLWFDSFLSALAGKMTRVKVAGKTATFFPFQSRSQERFD